MDRTPIKNFGQKRTSKHFGPTFIGGSMLMVHLGLELLKNSKTLWTLRKDYKSRALNSHPRVVIFSDNLDEINGIAVNSRILVNHIQSKGNDITLIGTAFHDKSGGFWEKNGTLLLPARFSMEMLGYEDNELAIPQMKEILRYFKRYPVDLVELEVPGLGGWIVLLMCKFIGVKVISHYRTDVIGYSQLLVKSRFMKWYIHAFTKAFCHLTKPVIVPSVDFKNKLIHEMNLDASDIIQLRRGIDLNNFYPALRSNNYFNSFREETNNDKQSVKYLFVGRVSKEKELPFLESIWRQFKKSSEVAELYIVGEGPYLKEMKENFNDSPEVYFTGGLKGEELASAYANADFFVFPSGTDTFGNVVVESIATGTPAIVTNSGGPRMIVEHAKSGWIVEWKNEVEWIGALKMAYELKLKDTEQYQKHRILAEERSKNFSLEEAGKEWWSFYESIIAIDS